MVEEGIRQYVKIIAGQSLGVKNDAYTPKKKETKLHVYNAAKDPKELPIDKHVTSAECDSNKFTIEKTSGEVQNNTAWKYMTVKEKIETIAASDKEIPQIELSDKDKEILRKLELEHEKNIKKKVASSSSSTHHLKTSEKEGAHQAQTEPEERPKAKLSVKPKQLVSIEINYIVHIFIRLV